MIKKIGCMGLLFIVLNACKTVEPYETVYLNDPNMDLADKKSNEFLTTIHSYREASAGGTGGKSGGGCGCN